MTDTSTEAVERLCRMVRTEIIHDEAIEFICKTLRTLAAERDKLHTGWMEAEAKVSELEAERDALKAEVERLNMALKEAEEEMASGCDATAYRVICASLQENPDD